LGPGCPPPGVVLRKAFEKPEGGNVKGIECSARPSPEDIELKNVGQFVLDKVLEFIERHVAVDGNAVEDRLAHTQDTLGDVEEVGLLEIGISGVIDKGHRVGQLVLEQVANFLIGAFGYGGKVLESLGIFDIKIDAEMVSRVTFPLEVLIHDFILPVIGIIEELLATKGKKDGQEEADEEEGAPNFHPSSFLS